jgi:hypothetical protein
MSSLSDQQLLDLYRNAIGALANNQSYSINGRTFTRSSLKDVWNMVQMLEQRIAMATNDTSGTGIALVTFNNPV